MSFAFGVQAIHPSSSSARPHILAYATARTVDDDTLLEIWNGPTSASLRAKLDKDGRWLIGAGDAAKPALAFTADPDTGMYRSAADTLAFATAGVNRAALSSVGLVLTVPVTASGNITADSGAGSSVRVRSISSGAQSGGFALVTSSGTRIIDMSGSDIRFLDLSGGNVRMSLSDGGVLTAGADVIATTNVRAGSASLLFWDARSRMRSPSDGVITIANAAENTFGRLQFGGTTNAFPALQRNGNALEVVLADASTYAPLASGAITVNGAGTITAVGLIQTTLTTQQLSLRYDASNHLAVTVASAGQVTLTATGASKVFAFNLGADAVTISATLLLSNVPVTLNAVDLMLSSGNRVRLDGNAAGDTFIREGSSDVMEFTAGGAVRFRINSPSNLTSVPSGTNFQVTDPMGVGGAGVSATTQLLFAAGASGVSPLRIPHGAAPSAPVNGDMWTTTAGLFVRINGVTVGPLS